MRYMLDTNTIVYARRNSPEAVLARLQQHSPGDLCISSITLAELEYGICKSSKPAANRAALMLLLPGIAVVPFDDRAAEEYGEIRARLEALGMLIGPYDLQIAAHAKSLGLVLVTHNTGEFMRVEGLQVEDWFGEGGTR